VLEHVPHDGGIEFRLHVLVQVASLDRDPRLARQDGAAPRRLDALRVIARLREGGDQTTRTGADIEHARARREACPPEEANRLTRDRALESRDGAGHARRRRRVLAGLVGVRRRRLAVRDGGPARGTALQFVARPVRRLAARDAAPRDERTPACGARPNRTRGGRIRLVA
jgi:hypothetical protein